MTVHYLVAAVVTHIFFVAWNDSKTNAKKTHTQQIGIKKIRYAVFTKRVFIGLKCQVATFCSWYYNITWTQKSQQQKFTRTHRDAQIVENKTRNGKTSSQQKRAFFWQTCNLASFVTYVKPIKLYVCVHCREWSCNIHVSFNVSMVFSFVHSSHLLIISV